jgi:hypothetical protein
MNTKTTLGIIAVGLSILSTCSVILGYNLSLNYHCDDPVWLAKSELKKGGYIAGDIYLPPKQACLHQTGNIFMLTFFLGLMMPWTIYFIWVGIWRSDIKEDEFEHMPSIQDLCRIHYQETVAKFLHIHKFQIQYKDNLGKCSQCPRDAICQFVKNEISRSPIT